MAMAIDFDWKKKQEGEDAVKGAIINLRDNFDEFLQEELAGVWQQIKDEAIEICPKESGALASSIKLGSEGGEGRVMTGDQEYTDTISAGSDDTFNARGQPTNQYALAVHEGHVLPNGEFWEGTPFLTDALDHFEPDIISAIQRAVSRALEDFEE